MRHDDKTNLEYLESLHYMYLKDLHSVLKRSKELYDLVDTYQEKIYEEKKILGIRL